MLMIIQKGVNVVGSFGLLKPTDILSCLGEDFLDQWVLFCCKSHGRIKIKGRFPFDCCLRSKCDLWMLLHILKKCLV